MYTTNINEESSNDINSIILDTINQIITKIEKPEKETEIEIVVEDVMENLLRRMVDCSKPSPIRLQSSTADWRP